MIGPMTPVVFHNHAMDAECVQDCYAIPTAPERTAEVRTERMPHNHILQSHNLAGEPDCPACENIDPLMMIRKPYRVGGDRYAVYDI